MKVTVTGRVRGKARPRVYRGHAFTPIETKTYENIIRCAYQNQSNIYYEGAIKIKIDVIIYFFLNIGNVECNAPNTKHKFETYQ